MRFQLAAACSIVFAIWAARAFGAEAAAPQPLEAPFVAGRDGYPVYRIPSLVVTKSGTLLAFAEGRANLRDHAENTIVLRRSTDGGHHWLPLQVVADERPKCLNNPTALVLHENGRVLLMYQRYPRDKDEHTVTDGVAGTDTCLTFITTSDDDGKRGQSPPISPRKSSDPEERRARRRGRASASSCAAANMPAESSFRSIKDRSAIVRYTQR